MASKLTPYYSEPLQSAFLKKIPDSIPPTPDLRTLQDELEELKKLSLARSKKAGDDMKAIEESMRRMKEKEKGKAKAPEKIKRERDFTPSLDADDAKSLHSLHGVNQKSRVPSHSSLPGSARNSVDPRRPSVDELKKKKKRKLEDSDAERDQRPRKSPPLAHTPSHPPPPKAQKPVPLPSHSPSKPPPGPDFTLPPSLPLLPPRPPIPPPPIPGPSKPADVMDDFSKLKQPAQTTVNTFYTSIEPWIRPIREEDVGFLEHTGDEVEPFIVPRLGRHYLEVWEEQDAGIVPPTPVSSAGGEGGGAEASTSSGHLEVGAPFPKWDPSTLAETDLVLEERGHGPLTERVISALLPLQDNNWKGVKAAEDAMEGRPGGSGAAAARKERLNVTELEARIRDTMRHHGLLDGVPDFSDKVDDPIATALRHAQRELRHVLATNKARKQRLIAIALDRLAYQEYLEARDSIDRNITTLYAKLQKKDNPKNSKKKNKQKPTESSDYHSNHGHNGNGNGNGGGHNGLGGSHNGNGSGGAGGNGASFGVQQVRPCPAGLGLNPDDELVLHVNEQLQQLVQTRRMWVDTVGAVFEDKQRLQPGRIWGLPTESVYLGVEEEAFSAQKAEGARGSMGGIGASVAIDATMGGAVGRAMVNKHPPAKPHDKGKAKEVWEDEMDVG